MKSSGRVKYNPLPEFFVQMMNGMFSALKFSKTIVTVGLRGRREITIFKLSPNLYFSLHFILLSICMKLYFFVIICIQTQYIN